MSISEVFNINNMEYMATIPNKFFDLVIADPPYGLGDRLSNGGGKRKDDPSRLLYVDKQWDVLPTSEYWLELFRVSNNQIVFGANYFFDYLPNTRGFVCWDKLQDMPTMSACELVWTSLDKPAKIYKCSSIDLNRFHATQKPVKLYKFMFDYAKCKQGDKIFDPNMGSQSSRIAAYDMGFDYWGCELDKEYFDKGNQRFENFKKQLKLL